MRWHTGLTGALVISLFVLLWPALSFAQVLPPEQEQVMPDQQQAVPYQQEAPLYQQQAVPYQQQAPPDQQVAPNEFYDQLAPYGRWIETPNMGMVWSPSNVPQGWRPYSTGHWVATDEGMTWVADEDWGWITFHYGRWLFEPGIGWVWIPGTVWSPGWVAWREGPGMVGWSALPPDWGWDFAIWRGTGDFDFDDIDDFGWNFIDADDLFRLDLDHHIRHMDVDRDFLERTHNITDIRIHGGRASDRTFSDDHLVRLTGRPIHRVMITDLGNGEKARRALLRGDELYVNRPVINGDVREMVRKHTLENGPATGRMMMPERRAPAGNGNMGWTMPRNEGFRGVTPQISPKHGGSFLAPTERPMIRPEGGNSHRGFLGGLFGGHSGATRTTGGFFHSRPGVSHATGGFFGGSPRVTHTTGGFSGGHSGGGRSGGGWSGGHSGGSHGETSRNIRG